VQGQNRLTFIVNYEQFRREKSRRTQTMDVIDADGHIVEKESDMRSYLPEPHCKRSGSLLPSDGQDSLMGGRLGGLEDNDLPTRIRDMDTEGISVSVLFPTTSFRVSQTTERNQRLPIAAPITILSPMSVIPIRA
jgi:hypothetical protein